MEFLARLSRKIGNDLIKSDIVKAEDAKIYIYGINQILTYVINVFSALIIGAILGVFLEITVFMAAYIPLRSFAGGYHAKTPLRCYIFFGDNAEPCFGWYKISLFDGMGLLCRFIGVGVERPCALPC